LSKAQEYIVDTCSVLKKAHAGEPLQTLD